MTKRERFLAEMEQVMLWAGYLAIVEPYYAKAKRGRPLVGLGQMLPVLLVQQWKNLSNEGVEGSFTRRTAKNRAERLLRSFRCGRVLPLLKLSIGVACGPILST
jgi:hypothetical protein